MTTQIRKRIIACVLFNELHSSLDKIQNEIKKIELAIDVTIVNLATVSKMSSQKIDVSLLDKHLENIDVSPSMKVFLMTSYKLLNGDMEFLDLPDDNLIQIIDPEIEPAGMVKITFPKEYDEFGSQKKVIAVYPRLKSIMDNFVYGYLIKNSIKLIDKEFFYEDFVLSFLEDLSFLRILKSKDLTLLKMHSFQKMLDSLNTMLIAFKQIEACKKFSAKKLSVISDAKQE